MSYRPQDCQHFSLATLRKKWKVGLCDHYTMEMAERHGKVQPRKRMPAKDRTPARSRGPGPARAEAVLAYPLTPVETEAAGGEFMEENVMGVDRKGPYLTFEFKDALGRAMKRMHVDKSSIQDIQSAIANFRELKPTGWKDQVRKLNIAESELIREEFNKSQEMQNWNDQFLHSPTKRQRPEGGPFTRREEEQDRRVRGSDYMRDAKRDQAWVKKKFLEHEFDRLERANPDYEHNKQMAKQRRIEKRHRLILRDFPNGVPARRPEHPSAPPMPSDTRFDSDGELKHIPTAPLCQTMWSFFTRTVCCALSPIGRCSPRPPPSARWRI
eukprot:jgi/Mesvir1/22342/Mv10248-RA.1